MLMRAYQESGDSTGAASFADESDIPQWSKPYIGKAVELGVITGYNGSFNPGDTATRAEAVSVLMRMIDKK
jgi:hypothetical protein